MTKAVEDSRRFVVGWGRHGDRIQFFIAHSELPETKGHPIPCKPEELAEKMIELAERIDLARGKI
ncbi:MAG: hypothetical protein AAC990_04995 [Dehalococcoides mccartyi]|uniref:hypothetical protein n=1 Tax=Dehalococcoides mccartyi TaxID=61435 RepID=UPI0030F8D3E8